MCGVKAIVIGLKVRAGIDHAAIQPECIELIRDVIVVGDCLPVALD